MKTISEEECKKIGLKILERVHLFCVQNKLRYVLFYGTLLGAIRHNGYIPWDDDIDIAMPREDYEKMIESFGDDNYGIMTYKVKGYHFPWAKVYDKQTIKIEPTRVPRGFEIGFNIDIFPLDFVISEIEYVSLKKRENNVISKWKKAILPYKITSFKILVRTVLWLPLYFNLRRYAQKIDLFFLNHSKANKEENNLNYLAANAVFWRKPNYLFGNDLFENLQLHIFEGREFYIPKNYDAVLKTCYGNYLELPPKDKQVSHHNYRCFYK